MASLSAVPEKVSIFVCICEKKLITRKKILSNKILITIVILLQFASPIYANGINVKMADCLRIKKDIQKHSCCEACDDQSSDENCSSEKNFDCAQSFQKCNCTYKTVGSNSEITLQKSYELIKPVKVEVVDLKNTENIFSTFFFKRNQSIFGNSPPLYLAESTLLI